jgi:DNA-binding response OmpR family regulator
MSSPPNFLIVDDNTDSRFLLVKTLLRKFPQAVLRETQDGESAVNLVRSENLDAVVVHRAAEIDGISLVRRLRQTNANVPIVMVSGLDRTKEAIEAGANTFLSYDAWLRIGTVVSELILSGKPSLAVPNEPDRVVSIDN